MRKRIIAVIVIVLVAAGAYKFFSGRAGRDSGSRLVVSGNIELTEVNIAFKTSGKLIERTVDEGDVVKKGQVIARLDSDQLRAQRDRDFAGLQSALAQLAQAEIALAWQKETLAADIEQRKAELSSAQARLQELKNGSRPQEIQEVKAAVESAQAERERARRDWEPHNTL
jgi:HlyD family secretion protein